MKPSSESISPSVVTSKSAQTDLQNIQAQHAEIVRGISEQSQRVAEMNRQKAAQLQNENSLRSEMEKAQLAANTTNTKNYLDHAAKQGELDIKRASLVQ